VLYEEESSEREREHQAEIAALKQRLEAAERGKAEAEIAAQLAEADVRASDQKRSDHKKAVRKAYEMSVRNRKRYESRMCQLCFTVWRHWNLHERSPLT